MFTFEQSVHITQEFYQLPEQLFDNPWFIGIITGFVSSVLASAVTGKYIWSKAENKMKNQKLIFIADKLDSIATNFDNANDYKNYIKTFIDASATKLNSDFRLQIIVDVLAVQQCSNRTINSIWLTTISE